MTLFYLTLAAELVLGIGLVISVVSPAHRVWPPPSRRSWQFWFVWAMIAFIFPSLGVLTVLSWNSFVFPYGLRYFVGFPLAMSGLVLYILGIGRLGAYNSAGLKGELMTGGLYCYSRNPQYLGGMVGLIGLVLFSNAFLVLLPGLLAALLFVLWPFSEEPWLRKRFGRDYERYCERVPRFL